MVARYDVLAGHRRRREAALRLPPPPHSGRRDPLSYAEIADGYERPAQHRDPEPYEHSLDGWRDTIGHFEDRDLPPIVPAGIRRQLHTSSRDYRRGARDALRRVWRLIPVEHRGVIESLAADYFDGAA